MASLNNNRPGLSLRGCIVDGVSRTLTQFPRSSSRASWTFVVCDSSSNSARLSSPCLLHIRTPTRRHLSRLVHRPAHHALCCHLPPPASELPLSSIWAGTDYTRCLPPRRIPRYFVALGFQSCPSVFRISIVQVHRHVKYRRTV